MFPLKIVSDEDELILTSRMSLGQRSMAIVRFFYRKGRRKITRQEAEFAKTHGVADIRRAWRVLIYGDTNLIDMVERNCMTVNAAYTEIVAREKRRDALDEVGRVSKGVGVARANEAINCLMRIPKNDELRERGFQIVRDWIKINK